MKVSGVGSARWIASLPKCNAAIAARTILFETTAQFFAVPDLGNESDHWTRSGRLVHQAIRMGTWLFLATNCTALLQRLSTASSPARTMWLIISTLTTSSSPLMPHLRRVEAPPTAYPRLARCARRRKLDLTKNSEEVGFRFGSGQQAAICAARCVRVMMRVTRGIPLHDGRCAMKSKCYSRNVTCYAFSLCMGDQYTFYPY